MFTNINNIRTNYIEKGTAANRNNPLLILHGWGCNASVYGGVIDSLSKKYRVIIPELPGFGETAEPPEAWSVSDYADFVLAFCKELALENCVIFAHSLGCRIAVKLLSEKSGNPALNVSKAVFTGGAGIKPKRTRRQKLRTRIFKAKKLFLKPFPKLVERMRQKYGSADYRAASPIMRECLVKIVNEDLTELLPSINVETLLIWGENDDSTPISDGRLMEKLLPDAGLAVIKNAGHYAFLEQPELFGKIMMSFL